jgi:putative transcriptional regulator
MIKHHPSTALLTDYTVGSLSVAPAVSVTTHLKYCQQCRDSVGSLKQLGGALLCEAEPAQISNDLLSQTLDRLDADESEMALAEGASEVHEFELSDELKGIPEYLNQFLPRNGLNWRKLSSSVTVAPISVGETRYELALHKICAGGQTPVHDHNGVEYTVVLKGSFSDEDGMYNEGDFLTREPGDIHRPFATQHEDCICLSVLEAPIRLKGLGRVLNPFMRFQPS